MPATDRPPPMADAELAVWADLVRGRCGLEFAGGRSRVLRECLWGRLTRLGLRSYLDYYHRVVYHPDGGAEWRELLDALPNHETSFFRHAATFEAVAGRVLPAVKDAKITADGPRVVRLWSAGCSTGAEAYSLAAACLDAPGARGWRFEVFGTDLSRQAVERARAGRFRGFELRGLPDDVRRRYFAEDRAGWRAGDELRQAVAFGTFNLVEPATFPPGGWDVVVCQNVLIYFDAARREAAVRDLGGRLSPGGHLFLGPAEVVGLRPPGLELLDWPGVLAYRRAA